MKDYKLGKVTSRNIASIAARHKKEVIRDFFLQWINYDRMSRITNDDSSFKSKRLERVNLLKKSARDFIDGVIESGSRSRDFMTTPLEPYTAQLDFIDQTSRYGILHHPAFLMLYSAPDGTSPVKRGKQVINNYLCQKIPAIPRNANVNLPPVGAGLKMTMRDRYKRDIYSAGEACTQCHKKLDPPGFGLEVFDSLAMFRSKDDGLNIDTRVSFEKLSISPFESDDHIDLVRGLASTEEYNLCSVIQFLRYLSGRDIYETDLPFLSQVYEEFMSSGTSLEVVFEKYLAYKTGVAP